MARGRRWPWIALGTAGALAAGAYVLYGGGEHEGPGTATVRRPPAAAIAEREAGDRRGPRRILFGDLHVHTTFSADAFMRSLPLLGGEGAHPPADACDFARFCSGLDFFALTDHAEGLTPRHWRETKESVRQCNAVAGDPASPDIVAFAGFEWSQVGRTPEEHHGHRNVIFRDIEDDRLPARPIAAPGLGSAFRSLSGAAGSLWRALLVPLLEFPRRQRYLNLWKYLRDNAAVDACPPGVDPRALPPDCREIARTPAELARKLAQWGHEALVIPHGTTWGFYTPPGYEFRVSRVQHDPARERLLEVFSGHGNSEEHRPWRAVERRPGREPVCPAPTAGYEPCCWRAGEIVRARCGDAPAAECERRVRKARADYLAAGVAGHLTVPGATVEDWKDCGQCRDCFNPAFQYRPGGSAQAILARGDFSDPARPFHAVFGFIASSDNHSARPGTGYKEIARRRMTEAAGPVDAAWRDRIFGEPAAPAPESVRLDPADLVRRPPFLTLHLERQASFFLTGGLVAVHADGRHRAAIWDALRRREVYGTSGPRILLWFDLVNGPKGRLPMGSRATLATTPRFAVRAVGAHRQKPGCPDWARDALGPARIDRLCAGECYHPAEARYRIVRIELVRVFRQRRADEPIEALVRDPWRRIECAPDPAGCQAEVEDPDFVSAARDAAYYARAVQEPTPAVNAAGIRCKRDSQGRCVRARPCYGDFRTPYGDDCLAPNEERAWSSPIYLSFAGGAR